MSSNPYAPYDANPYGGSTEHGNAQYDESTQNAQPQSYEMRNLNNTAPAQQSAYVQPLNQRDYLEQVDLVRNLLKETDTSLQEVATLHNRLLSADDTSADTEAGSRLQNIESETMSRNNQIRRFIQRLAQDAANTTDNTKDMKNRQVGPLRREFQNKLTAYQGLERDYRTARQEQIRRQYMIVNPDATDGELAAVADASTDSHSQGVFQMALNNRRGQAATALSQVRQRHTELQRIEQTITQLAAMFNDVEALVTAQEPLVEETEHNAIQTQTDVENANTHVDKAIGFARNRNKLKWWCLLIVILIILGIALGIGLGVGLNRAVSTGNNSRQLDGIDNRGGEGNNGGRPGDSVNDGFGPNGSNDGLARVGGRNGTSDGKPRL